MLDEPSLRRPDFLGGLPLRLADGQTWIFPAPIRPISDSADSLDDSVIAEFGPDYLPTLRAVTEAQDHTERLRAELALAIALLSRNYTLSPAEYCHVLEGPCIDADLRDMQEAFHALATAHRSAFIYDGGLDASHPATRERRDLTKPAQIGG